MDSNDDIRNTDDTEGHMPRIGKFVEDAGQAEHTEDTEDTEGHMPRIGKYVEDAGQAEHTEHAEDTEDTEGHGIRWGG